jgi:hypothetical protein
MHPTLLPNHNAEHPQSLSSQPSGATMRRAEPGPSVTSHTQPPSRLPHCRPRACLLSLSSSGLLALGGCSGSRGPIYRLARAVVSNAGVASSVLKTMLNAFSKMGPRDKPEDDNLLFLSCLSAKAFTSNRLPPTSRPRKSTCAQRSDCPGSLPQAIYPSRLTTPVSASKSIQRARGRSSASALVWRFRSSPQLATGGFANCEI